VEKAYAAWRAFQDRFLAHVAALLLLGCTLLALAEVVRRYVFGFSYEWQQDAVLGPRARRAADFVRLFALGFSFLFLLAVVWWGIPEVEDSMRYETRTESLGFPMWPFLGALILGFAFMAVTMLFQIYRTVQKLRGRAVLQEPTEKEEGFH
jgi:TRAP-type C4-dicarboxylate transport system permease small subunit